MTETIIGYGRYDDPTIVQCESCDWKGAVKECRHGYKGIPFSRNDVEPCDYCPKCNSEDIWETK